MHTYLEVTLLYTVRIVSDTCRLGLESGGREKKVPY